MPGTVLEDEDTAVYKTNKNPWPRGADIYMLNGNCLGDGSLGKRLECFRWNKHVSSANWVNNVVAF